MARPAALPSVGPARRGAVAGCQAGAVQWPSVGPAGAARHVFIAPAGNGPHPSAASASFVPVRRHAVLSYYRRLHRDWQRMSDPAFYPVQLPADRTRRRAPFMTLRERRPARASPPARSAVLSDLPLPHILQPICDASSGRGQTSK